MLLSMTRFSIFHRQRTPSWRMQTGTIKATATLKEDDLIKSLLNDTITIDDPIVDSQEEPEVIDLNTSPAAS